VSVGNHFTVLTLTVTDGIDKEPRLLLRFPVSLFQPTAPFLPGRPVFWPPVPWPESSVKWKCVLFCTFPEVNFLVESAPENKKCV